MTWTRMWKFGRSMRMTWVIFLSTSPKQKIGIKWMPEFAEAHSSSVFEEMNPDDNGFRGCHPI